jgi:hypothetical protein
MTNLIRLIKKSTREELIMHKKKEHEKKEHHKEMSCKGMKEPKGMKEHHKEKKHKK